MLGPMKSVVALLLLANCTTFQLTEVSATEAAICESLGQALPTRSRLDTAQTILEIEVAYNAFVAACPDFAHLVPE